jgi:hypothetical protein
MSNLPQKNTTLKTALVRDVAGTFSGSIRSTGINRIDLKLKIRNKNASSPLHVASTWLCHTNGGIYCAGAIISVHCRGKGGKALDRRRKAAGSERRHGHFAEGGGTAENNARKEHVAG